MKRLFQKIYLTCVYPLILLKVFLDKYFYKMEPETEIYKNLYQGRFYFFSKDFERIKQKNIKVIIDMTIEFDNKKALDFFKSNDIIYYNFGVFDWRPVPLKSLVEISKIINEFLNKGEKVLVNCAFWHWRSFQGTLFYHINNLWMNYDKGFDSIKSKRTLSKLNYIQKKHFLQIIKKNF